MVESTKKKTGKYPYTYCSKQKLGQALDIPKEYIPCRVSSYLMQNAEKHFEPKKVHTSSDWLVTQTECGQTPKRYKQGGPNITWMNPRLKKIVLFIIDDTIDEQTSEQFRLYCEAYFYGAEVSILMPG